MGTKLEETAPDTIWLNVGFDKDEVEVDFSELDEVCWSEERIFGSDIEYIKKSCLDGYIEKFCLEREPDYWLYKGLIYKNGVIPFEGFRSWDKNMTREEFMESWKRESVPLYTRPKPKE